MSEQTPGDPGHQPHPRSEPAPQQGPPQYGSAPQHGQAPQQGQAQYGPPQHGQPQYGPPQPGQPGAPYSGGYAGTYGGPAPEMSPSDQRLWSMLAHLSGLASWFIGLPFVGPLVIYLVLRERGVFVRRQSAEALNFQILVTVVMVAGIAIGMFTLGLGFIITGPLMVVGGLVALVFTIMAAVKANQGIDYRYPVNWRLVK